MALRAPLLGLLPLLITACGPELFDEPLDADELFTEEAAIQASATRINGFPVRAHFTRPPAFDGDDRTIIREVIRLIRETPDTAEIRAAIHSLTLGGVAGALVDAHARGVLVRVVQDGKNWGPDDENEAPDRVEAALGADNLFCRSGSNHGCVTSSSTGIMHTKLFLFSATKDPAGVLRRNVTWFGSANMTGQTGAETFNNTVTVYGDSELYLAMKEYFSDLFNERHASGNDYFDAELQRGFATTPTARVYASPEQDGDLIDKRLNDIEPDGDCRIRVMQAMMFDSRTNLIDRLGRLKSRGCKVWVAVNHLQDQAKARLRLHRLTTRKVRVHDKSIVVQARFAGSREVRNLVFTGSHNWTRSANEHNDELFVRLESADLYRAYVKHFNDAYSIGDPL